jgi:hypothetical protein
MFRVAYRSSSEALNYICSLWFICPYGDRLLPSLGGHLELLIMSGVPLETCWVFKKLWNNKFYYKNCILVGISTELRQYCVDCGRLLINDEMESVRNAPRLFNFFCGSYWTTEDEFEKFQSRQLVFGAGFKPLSSGIEVSSTSIVTWRRLLFDTSFVWYVVLHRLSLELRR